MFLLLLITIDVFPSIRESVESTALPTRKPNPFAFRAETEGQVEAVVDYRYPPGELPKSDKTLMALITQFCFPDKEKFPKLKLGSKNKKFTFVVTNIEGVKRFGYCRRELVGEIWQGKRWAVCHCVLSLNPCHPLFDAILEGGSKFASKDMLEPFCQSLQTHKIPLPGDSISVTTTNPETGSQTTLKFTRPSDDQSLSGFADFSALLEYLDPFTLLNVITSILLERRVIFVSSKLSVLSSCVQGVVALLYPFVWQHVFIPVLPLGMIQFVCAPVPFVVGLLQHHLPDLEAYSDAMEEVLLVDIDSSNILPPAVDYRLLPEDLIREFNTSLHLAARALKKSGKRKDKDKDKEKDKDKDEEPTSAESVAQQFLELGCVDFLAQLMGPYKMFLTKDSFDKDGFIAELPSLQKFREAFSGSQMFEQFIVQRQSTLLADRAADGRFERRLTATKTLHLGTAETSANVVGLKADLALPTGVGDNDPIVAAMSTDINEVVLRTGWLAKFGKGLKGHWAASRGHDTSEVGSWQARYFRLTWTKFHYYRYRQDTLAAGTIDLNTVYSTEMLENHKGRENVLEIKTPERIYYVYSANPADLSNWRDVLQYRVRKNDFSSTSAVTQQQQQAYQEQLAQARGKNVKQLLSGVRSGSVGSRNDGDGDAEESTSKKKGLKSKLKGLISNKSKQQSSSDDSAAPRETSPTASPKQTPKSMTKSPSGAVISNPDLLKRATIDATRILPQSRPRGLSRDDSTLPSPTGARRWQSGRPTDAVPVQPPITAKATASSAKSPPGKAAAPGGAHTKAPPRPPKPTHMRGHDLDEGDSQSSFQPPPQNRVQSNARRFAAEFSTEGKQKDVRRETMFVGAEAHGAGSSTSSHDGLQRSVTSPGFAPLPNPPASLRNSGRQGAVSMRLPQSTSQALAAQINAQLSSSSTFAPPANAKGGSSRPRSIQNGGGDHPASSGGVAKLTSLFDAPPTAGAPSPRNSIAKNK